MIGQCASDKAAEIFNTTVGRKAAGKFGIRTLFAQLFENFGGLAQSCSNRWYFEDHLQVTVCKSPLL